LLFAARRATPTPHDDRVRRRRDNGKAVFGSGRPFFATGALAEPLLLENPTTIVRGDRVTHLVYDVGRRDGGGRPGQ
jgi:hypothetical protein